MNQPDYSQCALGDLFLQEAEQQTSVLVQGLVALEQNSSPAQLETLMRAAHSLKGAAHIVGLHAAVQVAHAMEDCLVAAQKGKIQLNPEAVDHLLRGVDVLLRMARTPAAHWERDRVEMRPTVDALVQVFAAITGGQTPAARPAALAVPNAAPPPAAATSASAVSTEVIPSATPAPAPAPSPPPSPAIDQEQDRFLRVTADKLNRLMGLAGESLVASRWLSDYAASLLRLKRQQWRLSKTLEDLRESLGHQVQDEMVAARLNEAQQQTMASLQSISDRHAEVETYFRQSANLSHRMYRAAVDIRLRPFADGIQGMPRLVRDLARSLGKEVQLRVSGEIIPVDREVLEKLEAPLNHLLRNAVDHGIELADERVRAGKPAKGTIQLEARHRAGWLMLTVQDDGQGIPLESLRQTIVRRKLTTEEVVRQLSPEELLDFLFLPGFSLRQTVTEISGRGVGLDVVASMVRSLRGTLKIASEAGRGTRFQMQLPLTLSVLRTLLVQIAGEPYALPLGRVHAVLRVSRAQVEMLEGREHIAYDRQRIGLVSAAHVLEKPPAPATDPLAVVVLGDRSKCFGVVVDQFLGERELVVQPLDSRLGKVKDISAAALLPDGAPVLIMDVEDFVHSIGQLATGGRLVKVGQTTAAQVARRHKRVLVVDDSLTVRELERKLLTARGYDVTVTVDGMEGWNAVRTQAFDLIITDIDMPRLDGIELVTLIKKDVRLKSLPVMIVSYKDREEDRQRGLAAGADYYLTKGSFHDETLIHAVTDLIGEPEVVN